MYTFALQRKYQRRNGDLIARAQVIQQNNNALYEEISAFSGEAIRYASEATVIFDEYRHRCSALLAKAAAADLEFGQLEEAIMAIPDPDPALVDFINNTAVGLEDEVADLQELLDDPLS